MNIKTCRLGTLNYEVIFLWFELIKYYLKMVLRLYYEVEEIYTQFWILFIHVNILPPIFSVKIYTFFKPHLRLPAILNSHTFQIFYSTILVNLQRKVEDSRCAVLTSQNISFSLNIF